MGRALSIFTNQTQCSLSTIYLFYFTIARWTFIWHFNLRRRSFDRFDFGNNFSRFYNLDYGTYSYSAKRGVEIAIDATK